MCHLQSSYGWVVYACRYDPRIGAWRDIVVDVGACVVQSITRQHSYKLGAWSKPITNGVSVCVCVNVCVCVCVCLCVRV